MKRVYKEFSYGKELAGYNYKGEYIEIEDDFNTKIKWYHITLDGQHLCFDKLKECKQYIDERR